MVGLFNDPTVVQAAHLFMRTNTARRIGPAIVLQRKFQNCATLEAADIKGRRPILLWSVPGSLQTANCRSMNDMPRRRFTMFLPASNPVCTGEVGDCQ